MIPSVVISRADGQTGAVRPGSEGILAIIAPSQKGTANQPAAYTRQDLALADFGDGPLVEAAAYVMSIARNPVLLIKGTADTVGAYGSFTAVGNGTSVITAGATEPYDDYDVLLTFPVGGTRGVAGATYTYSLDGGVTTSGVIALGTDVSILIPRSNVTIALAAGTFLAGQTTSFKTTAPAMSNANLVTALEALRVSSQAWDTVLAWGPSTGTTLSTVDTWLGLLEVVGQFKMGAINARPKNAGESEASYVTAMATAWNASSSIRVFVGADAGDLVSSVRGIVQRRPAVLGIAARSMASDISRDPAYVADGPLPAFSVADARGNPKNHDELLYPGLDDLRLSSLRTIAGKQGVYVNNGLLLSAAGSDYVFIQHGRVMNKAADLTYQILTNQLSIGVRKNAKTNFILEEDAQQIEGLVNAALDRDLVTPKRVTAAAFVLSRTDDLSANSGATLNGEIQVSALSYVKKFAVTAKFVKKITASAA